MLEYKPVNSLTVDEARVLMENESARALLGVDLRRVTAAGDTPLTVALASPERSPDFWAQYLAGLHVALLEVNQATYGALARIPGLLPEQVNWVVKARPYFSLADLSMEGPDLQEVVRRAGPYLTHEGYVFVDKPRGRMVEFLPAGSGLLVRYRSGVTTAAIDEVLRTAGLRERGRDSQERVLACYWDVSAPSGERPARRRVLKESAVVESVAPFLEDAQGGVRFPYPDRLDLALHSNADRMDWERIMNRFRLRTVQPYTGNYGSVRIEAHPHDLGALYRTLRNLAKDPKVHFVEPTYLVLEH
jgi:hypothetical protein